MPAGSLPPHFHAEYGEHTAEIELGSLKVEGAVAIMATLISVPAGALGDRHGPPRVVLAGAGAFLASYIVLAPTDLRGSAFGILATTQSVGNLAASATAGIGWTAISPTAAFLFAAAAMLVALVAFSSGILTGRLAENAGS